MPQDFYSYRVVCATGIIQPNVVALLQDAGRKLQVTSYKMVSLFVDPTYKNANVEGSK